MAGFETEAAEACPHKHEMAAAAELSALLVRLCVHPGLHSALAERAPRAIFLSQEGSKFVNARKGGETPVAVASLPQLQGSVRECLQASALLMRVRLVA